MAVVSITVEGLHGDSGQPENDEFLTQ